MESRTIEEGCSGKYHPSETCIVKKGNLVEIRGPLKFDSEKRAALTNFVRSKWQLKANFTSSKPQSLANFTPVKWVPFLKLQPPKVTSPSKVEESKTVVISNDVPQNLVEWGKFTSFNQVNL